MKYRSEQPSTDYPRATPLSFFNRQTGANAVVQTKLTVGSANDAHEHEANKTADMVMRKPENSAKNGVYTEWSLFTPTITPVIQRACAHCEQEKEQTAQRKETGAATGGFTAPDSVSRAISRGGNALDGNAKTFMESRFNRSFDAVQVHTDGESAASARDISARAYTSGNHIVFGEGQYQPNTEGGRHLLAHELTHVVQQMGSVRVQREITEHSEREYSTHATALSKQAAAQQNTPSTPMDSAAQAQLTGGFTLTVNGVAIIVLPDRVSSVAGSSAETSFNFSQSSIAGPQLDAHHHVASFTPPNPITVTIQTTYRANAAPTGSSGYGRGTTAADIAAGTTTLRFHEGSHGSGYIAFIRSNPTPVFGGSVGMTNHQFQQAMSTYFAALTAYSQAMNQDSLANTDCVGTTIDQYNHTQVCP